jgi:hypothetical protein
MAINKMPLLPNFIQLRISNLKNLPIDRVFSTDCKSPRLKSETWGTRHPLDLYCSRTLMTMEA